MHRERAVIIGHSSITDNYNKTQEIKNMIMSIAWQLVHSPSPGLPQQNAGNILIECFTMSCLDITEYPPQLYATCITEALSRKPQFTNYFQTVLSPLYGCVINRQ